MAGGATSPPIWRAAINTVVPGSTSIVSPGKAWSTAAWIEPPGVTVMVRRPGRAGLGAAVSWRGLMIGGGGSTANRAAADVIGACVEGAEGAAWLDGAGAAGAAAAGATGRASTGRPDEPSEVGEGCASAPELRPELKPDGRGAIAEGRNPLSLTASACLTSPVITIRDEASLDECTDLMESKHIRRVPVVDASGALVGIVAQADVARHASRKDAGELVRAGVDNLGVRRRLAEAHVHDDLLDLRNGHHVGVAELFRERRHDFFLVTLSQAVHLSTTPSHLRQIRTLRPSPSILWPMRVCAPHSGHSSWTLDA